MENRFIRLLVGFIITTNNRLQNFQTSCWNDHKVKYSCVIFLLDFHKYDWRSKKDIKFVELFYNFQFVSHSHNHYNKNSSKL